MGGGGYFTLSKAARGERDHKFASNDEVQEILWMYHHKKAKVDAGFNTIHT
jgi:hypothetical protein